MTVAEISKYINKIIHSLKIAPLDIPKNDVMMILYKIQNDLNNLEIKAKWLETDLWEDGIGDIYKCSNCGNNHMDHMNYCSSCGARMEDEQ